MHIHTYNISIAWYKIYITISTYLIEIHRSIGMHLAALACLEAMCDALQNGGERGHSDPGTNQNGVLALEDFTRGRTVWTSDANLVVGLEFVKLYFSELDQTHHDIFHSQLYFRLSLSYVTIRPMVLITDDTRLNRHNSIRNTADCYRFNCLEWSIFTYWIE